jgi:hypothetical protein
MGREILLYFMLGIIILFGLLKFWWTLNSIFIGFALCFLLTIVIIRINMY